MLHFRLGSIPVRITGPFFFLLLVLGTSYGRDQRIDLIAVWAVIAFVSVLTHELGHALVGRAFGLQPVIELNGMGGLTSWLNGRDVGHWRAIAISVAGPFAGFAVAGLLLLTMRLGFHPQHPLAVFALDKALFVNIVWGVFNLVPMLPLDGGNVLRSGLNLLTKDRGEKPARIISIVVGGLLLAFAFLRGQWWLGALAGMFTWSNFQAYRSVDTRRADAALATAIQEAYVALEKHDGSAAIALLRPVIVPGTSADLRAIALRVFCYALLIEGEWDELLPNLRQNAALIGKEEMERYARTAHELGRELEADRILEVITQQTPALPRPANDFG